MSNKTLPYCCEHGLKDEVIALLAKGEDVNQKDGSNRFPLHYAAIGGYTEIVAMLLERGALVNCSTPRGATPLHYASRGGRIECIQLLIDNKADVNCRDGAGSTPLHTALQCNETKCAIALIETFGADVNLKTAEGSTALHLASARGLVPVIVALLENGAKSDVRDSKENSPFQSLPINLTDNDKKEIKYESSISQDISKLFNINKNREFSGVGQKEDSNNMKIDQQESLSASSDKFYSDITFLIENQKIYAHKCILQARCPNFLSSINSKIEQQQKPIEIKDYSFKLFLSFIEWIYTGSIEKFESTSKSIDLSYQFSVLLMGEKFDCKGLVSYCREFVNKNIGDSNVGSIWSIIKKLSTSTRSNLGNLIRDCLITMVKSWNIFTMSKTFSTDINKSDLIEIIKSLAPFITETTISEIKQARTANANASNSNQSKTPAKRPSTNTPQNNTSSTNSQQNNSSNTSSTPLKSSSSSSSSSSTPSKLTSTSSSSSSSLSSSSSSSSNYSDSMNEKNLIFCKGLINGMFKKKTSLAFQRPVDPLAEGIPDYFDVIKNPMDLSTIKNTLDNNGYSTIKDFAADVRLMFENALTYNADSSPVWKHAKTLLNAFDQKFLQNFPNEKPPTYKAPPTPIPIPQPNTSTPTSDKKRKHDEHVKVKEDTNSAQPTNSSSSNYTNGENASSSSSSKQSNSTTTSSSTTQKKYSDEERRNLMERINELAPDDVQEVLNIIDPNAIKQGDESLEIDMYQIDDKNLSQVESFINECFKKQKQDE
ncbi:hypothetical protein ACTFIV_006798 [Dictyostelium citrinum]